MSLVKKIFIGISIFIVLIIALNFGLSHWITKKLPSIIASEKDFPYNISYQDLDISLINGNITIHNAAIAPKDSTASITKKGVFGQVKTIEIRHFNLWALLKDDKIKVKKVIIDTPEIILYDREKKYNANDDFVKPFKNTITTGSLEIKKGLFKMMDSKEKFLVKAANINFTLDDIKVDSASVAENIPVRYTGYKFACDSLFYQADKFYHITANKVAHSDSTLTINDFKLVPEYNRTGFTKTLAKEKDLFSITAKTINVPSANWGFINKVLYVHSPEVVIEQLYANIYRNKLPNDDPSTKKLYSELLRSIKFDLKVDKVLLKNSVIEYEEQLNWQKPAAKVSFSKFYATVSNVYSPVNKSKLPNTTIDVQCLFMKTAPLKVQWFFNTMDKSDSFTLKGSLKNIRSEKINPVSKPLMNAKTSGELNEIVFTINGNKEKATGDFAINYDDLKVELYKKDGKKKNKLLSAVGNLVVKNDSNDELKKTSFEVVRLKDKSVFNLVWRCVQEGLKKTVLPKAISALLPKDGK